MGPITTPKVVVVPVPFVDREESFFNLTVDGPHYDTNIYRLPGAVVERKKSFDLMGDGPRFDTNHCRHSGGSGRVRTEH
ncbi:hypothetical protein L484_000109 [Morus notabilis]|uniref:Uncharacterized protein n=1 Tax=Morus notabilis TaxID=981085 RepID=W9RAW3_9ROSA|nr:hypothetical protein L484_000109 [Morus notabilis]